MFTLVPNDIMFIIICNLTNIYEVINISSINKETYKLFDDNLYLYWGRNLYTKEFWDKARIRTPSVSKPLINMKMELLRIHNFQNHLKKHGFSMWNNEDFYKYWDSMEKIWSKKDCAISLPVGAIPLAVGGVGVPSTNEEIYTALEIL